MSAEDYFDVGGEYADLEYQREKLADRVAEVEAKIDALQAKLGVWAKTNKRYLSLLRKRQELNRELNGW